MQNVLEILLWYKKNLRDLPWRNGQNPYHIWLSEVILQQTQVVQGINYYYRFLAEYPRVEDLAAASEQEVLKLWQGLGYYSRARNLLKTAKIITEQYHGKFPSDVKTLLSLPGIGDYTASAILSFAFNLPYPVLDANVYRVVSRLYNIDLPVNESSSRPAYLEVIKEMLGENDSAIFNNAMMELGALVCKPENPQCHICPCSGFCIAKEKGTQKLLPIKKAKTAKRKRFFYFYYVRYQDNFYLEKRADSDIWKHLYQLPLIETEMAMETGDIIENCNKYLLSETTYKLGKQKQYKHLLTHQEIAAVFIEVIVMETPVFKRKGLIMVDQETSQKYPVPILVEKFLLSL